MPSVVFFRAVNVGGHQKFRPSKLATDMAKFGVVNIGAAGTFVVRENVSPVKLRTEILRRLPFQPELMICSARDILTLLRSDPFRDAPAGKEITRYVTVMQKAPRSLPKMPFDQPTGGKWELRILAITGRFAVSIRHPGRLGVYPNALVEKQFKLPATTRNWNTMVAICEILEK